ncbi:MAG TPA: hypothetical protein PKA61_10385 [Nitrospira sp.]|nr:hypothetical protein [Nitrospira sp.]
MKTVHSAIMLAIGLTVGTSTAVAIASDHEPAGPSGTHEQVITQQTETNLAGNRLVTGRVKEIRGNQIEVDIGNPKSLYVPLKPAMDKGQSFKPGDLIIITLNDHNALVDYHRPGETSHHQVIEGKLETPLTVGLDKAVIITPQGTKTFVVAERAKSKLGTIPVGVPAVFLADETGQLVDAQPGGLSAAAQSAKSPRTPIKGAHEQLRAVFQGTGSEGRLRISEGGKEREVQFRPPLEKLDRIKPGQEVVLLMDEQGYVLEIATPDLVPVR